LLLAVSLVLVACGQRQMMYATGRMRSQMVTGNYQLALASLRQSKGEAFREQDRVVYWMNEGMLLHLTGQHREATQVLGKADRRSEELYTKSVRKEIAAAFVSDAKTDYAGEDYERVLINVVKALSYAALGDYESALVEARKINDKLKFYAATYGGQHSYKRDAFAHWLMGLLFEIEGSYDDARIAYANALKIYRRDFADDYGMQPPGYLAEDLARVAVLNEDEDLLERYRQELGADGSTAEAFETRGEIVLVHFNGQGPTKRDFFITCWFRSAHDWACDGEPGGEFFTRTRIVVPKDGTVVKVAFPMMTLRPPANPYLTMSVAGVTARSQPAYPLNAIAAKTLRDKTGRIFRRAVIRAITKALTQNAAGAAGKKAGGKDLGWLAKTVASIATQATEEADKRTWATLPARIDIARALVAPGSHTVDINLPNGRSGRLTGIEVAAGQRVVVSYMTLP
jgi:tetratricopeptide (TPR) repeat protein